MHEEPGAQHAWLDRLVGEWDYEGECIMGEGQPPAKSGGTEVVRSLGGLWVVAEGTGEMPGGGTARTIMTLGYDPRRDRIVGTFVASMMTHLWVYDGAFDGEGRVLTLDAEGPDFTSTKLAKYQDIIEFIDGDHRVMTSQALGDDGNWNRFMTMHYRRTSR